MALRSQRLAAANNTLHCFSLHPAESAGWIPIKQAHNIQVPPHRSLQRGFFSVDLTKRAHFA
jgi:hypothetical protein